MVLPPAENPSAKDKKPVLVRLVKNASALPIPVDNPANNVNPNAIRTV